jgi:hypothetical protein
MKEAMKHPMAVALIVPVLILGIFGLVHMATSGSAEEPNAELAAEIAEIRQLHRGAAGLVARIEAVSTEEPVEKLAGVTLVAARDRDGSGRGAEVARSTRPGG